MENLIIPKLLFNKHILIGEDCQSRETAFAVCYGLADKFSISIIKGQEYACAYNLRVATEFVGNDVPDSFYRGFPMSVEKLDNYKILFDQLIEYFISYDLGIKEGESKSLFEEKIERTLLNERKDIKRFTIVSPKEGEKIIEEMFYNFLRSTRPLNINELLFIDEAKKRYNFKIDSIASKKVACDLLNITSNPEYAAFINLGDVLKFVNDFNISVYNNYNIKKLFFKNKHKKFISKVLDIVLSNANEDQLRTALEKKKIWVGLLHHIHYKPTNKIGRMFVDSVRGNIDIFKTIPSEINRYFKNNEYEKAIDLSLSKGSSFFIRNLNRFYSEAKCEEDKEYLFSKIRSLNLTTAIPAIQYIINSDNFTVDNRIFKFTKNNKLVVVQEDKNNRPTKLDESLLQEEIIPDLENALKLKYKDLIDHKVFIDEGMKKISIPLENSVSNSGFNTLYGGSRVSLNSKNVRCFTYWKYTNDIDLSCFLIDNDNRIEEYSWRCGSKNNSNGICFSGDVTRGYDGGSEYFDIEIDKLLNKNPNAKYIVFANNIYSCNETPKGFSGIECTAGFMLREDLRAGEIFEPSTVSTSFRISNDSIYAILFAIDLETKEMIWIDKGISSRTNVAGNTDIQRQILSYATMLDKINLYDFIKMCSREVVDDIKDADFVVSDKTKEADLRSYDKDKILDLLNK